MKVPGGKRQKYGFAGTKETLIPGLGFGISGKSLNYTPNAIARAMVRQQTENIAFIINEKQSPAVLNPFYSPILEAVMRESARRNYSVFVVTNQDVLLPNGEVYIKKPMMVDPIWPPVGNVPI